MDNEAARAHFLRLAEHVEFYCLNTLGVIARTVNNVAAGGIGAASINLELLLRYTNDTIQMIPPLWGAVREPDVAHFHTVPTRLLVEVGRLRQVAQLDAEGIARIPFAEWGEQPDGRTFHPWLALEAWLNHLSRSVRAVAHTIGSREPNAAGEFVDDRALSYAGWRSHCDYLSSLEIVSAVARFGGPGESAYARAGEAIFAKYRDARITPRFAKGAAEHFISEMRSCDDLPKRLESMPPPSRKPFLECGAARRIATDLHRILCDAVPLELEDAPDMPGTDAITPRAALAIADKLRKACVRRMNATAAGPIAPPPPPPPRQTLARSDAAQRAGVEPSTIKKWVDAWFKTDKGVEAVSPDDGSRVYVDSLDAWTAARDQREKLREQGARRTTREAQRIERQDADARAKRNGK